MAYTQPFYINGPSLSSSTAVFDDAALTICSPNGFYSDGIVTREQVDCVLLPEQICTACCSDPCSGWTITTLLGTVTVRYESCAEQAVVEQTFTGPFDESLCVVYGTTPDIIFGKADLVHYQTCGCCSQDCNRYVVFGIEGILEFSFIDCSGFEETAYFAINGSTFCCKNNTTPTVISGIGFIGFDSCGCEK
jgi:hypothetical protein